MDWNSVLPQIITAVSTVVAALAGAWAAQWTEGKRAKVENARRAEDRQLESIAVQRSAVLDFLATHRSLIDEAGGYFLNDHRSRIRGAWEIMDVQLSDPELRRISAKIGSRYAHNDPKTITIVNVPIGEGNEDDTVFSELRKAAALLSLSPHPG